MTPTPILDSDALFRRLEEEDFQGEFTVSRLKSSAFSDPVGEPSVHLQRLADFKAISKLYPETLFYAVLKVGTIRDEGFDAIHRPTTSDVSHSVIVMPEGGLKKKAASRKLKKLVSMLVELCVNPKTSSDKGKS